MADLCPLLLHDHRLHGRSRASVDGALMSRFDVWPRAQPGVFPNVGTPPLLRRRHLVLTATDILWKTDCKSRAGSGEAGQKHTHQQVNSYSERDRRVINEAKCPPHQQKEWLFALILSMAWLASSATHLLPQPQRKPS